MSPGPPCPEAVAALQRRVLLLLLPVLLLAPGWATAAESTPGGQAVLTPDTTQEQFGTIAPGNSDLYSDIRAPEGADVAIIITVTPLDAGSGDVDLYCNPSDQGTPGPEYAQYSSESIGINQDIVFIPPPETPKEDGSRPVYNCVVTNPGVTMTPVRYKITKTFQVGTTSLTDTEQAVAQQLFDRCCQADGSCQIWKVKSEKAAAAAKAQAPAGEPAPAPGGSGTYADTDLCQFGVCQGGYLTMFNARGWDLSCPFPGDLFAQFSKLEKLYLSYNSFTGDINEAAKNLSALPNLQELGLYNNKMTGSLGDDSEVCRLVQGTVEMLQLGAMGLTGSLPSCLFNDNSTLYQFSAMYNELTGSIPDAFATATRLQVLNLAVNKLTGTVPATLAAAPNLAIMDLSNNSLSGPVPELASNYLSAVSLAFNKLTGAVPESLAEHPTLQTLYVQGNELTALPKKWSHKPTTAQTAPLNDFRASLNQIEGKFPTYLAGFRNLTILLLDSNKLSGVLPDPSQGQYPDLRYFSAANNSFVGSLGEGWSTTGIFQLDPRSPIPQYWNVLDLEDNQLTGAVPAYLTDADQVKVFLEGNKFSTSIMKSGSEGLSPGAIAGITFGALLAVTAAVGAGLWYCKRRQQRGPQAGASGVKFDRFVDEAPGPSGQPRYTPTFYEALPVPDAASPSAANGMQRVELSDGGAAGFNRV